MPGSYTTAGGRERQKRHSVIFYSCGHLVSEFMPVYLKEGRQPQLFIHIPKTGGSSFSAGMIEAGWREIFSIRGVHANDLSFAYCSPQHYHAEILESLFDLVRFEKIIAILRDPFARLVSEYCWQLHQGMTGLAPAEWISVAFRNYSDNPYLYDNHIRPQSDFILKGATLFRLEHCGVEEALAFSASSEGIAAGNHPAGRTSELPGRGLHLKKTIGNPSLYNAFSPLRDLIMTFYQRDYDLLESL